MKIYTNTFDLARISPHRFWVSPYSDFKIGVKIVKNGEAVANTFTVKAGATTLTPDETTVDGFKTYTVKSDDTGFVEYTIEVANVAEKMKLLQIVTDSTVFEVGGSGGGDVPADVATKTWVNSQISDFITEEALDGYATEGYVDSAISDFVTDDELTAYATKAELTAYAETADLTAYATVDSLSDYAEASALTAYAQKTDIKDSTITITQGGVTKGSFTLNQATGDTIELDAGGGGSSAISAFDLSESPVWSKTQVEEAAHNNICLPQTIYLGNNKKIIAVHNLSGAYSSSSPAGSFSSAVKGLVIGTQITAFNGIPNYVAPDIYGGGLVLPNTLKTIGNGAFDNGCGRADRNENIEINIPDSVTSIYNPKYSVSTINGWRYMDFGNTRRTIPTVTSTSGVDASCKYYVPDALYDSWIVASGWSNISAQIHRHSELEAPYATSTAVSALTAANSKVTGGAETGTTGTPAAVNTVKSVYETDWQTLSASADASTFYVVVPDPE